MNDDENTPDGSITVGDSAENLAAIREFISSANDPSEPAKPYENEHE